MTRITVYSLHTVQWKHLQIAIVLCLKFLEISLSFWNTVRMPVVTYEERLFWRCAKGESGQVSSHIQRILVLCGCVFWFVTVGEMALDTGPPTPPMLLHIWRSGSWQGADLIPWPFVTIRCMKNCLARLKRRVRSLFLVFLFFPPLTLFFPPYESLGRKKFQVMFCFTVHIGSANHRNDILLRSMQSTWKKAHFGL